MSEGTKEIRLYFSDASAADIEAAAEAYSGVELQRREIVWHSIGPEKPPSAYFLCGPIRALEAVVVAFMKHRKKELTFYTDGNKRIISLKASNYSAEDIRKFIKQAASIVEKE